MGAYSWNVATSEMLVGCWTAAGLCLDLDRGRLGDPKSVRHLFRSAASEKCGTPGPQVINHINYHHIRSFAVGMLFNIEIIYEYICVPCMCCWLMCFPFRSGLCCTWLQLCGSNSYSNRLLIGSDAHGQIVNDTLSVNDTNGYLAETVSTTTLARSACHVACDGLSALQATMTDLKTRDAEGEDVTLLDQCLAVQRHVEAVQCLLQGPGKEEDSCISVFDQPRGPQGELCDGRPGHSHSAGWEHVPSNSLHPLWSCIWTDPPC